MVIKKLQVVGSQFTEGGVTRQRVQLNQIKKGPRLVTCTPEEAERLYQSEGLEQMALKIAVTTSLRLVEGHKALVACRLKGLLEIEVYVLGETPALAAFLHACRTLAGQLNPPSVGP
jgi:hypothetical protein